MNEIVLKRIERAKYLLNNVRHIAMATVNKDGSPHNSPLAFFYDLHAGYLYWSSHPDSLYSHNIKRTQQAFFALYEGNAGGGLFIKANEAEELAGNEVQVGLALLNAQRLADGKQAVPQSHFANQALQRLYRAKIRSVYINYSQRDANGLVVKDIRHEITVQDLIA